MPERVFLPYKYAEGALELSVRSLLLDGRQIEPGEFVDGDHTTIALAGQGDWIEASLEIEAEDPNRELESLLLEEESLSTAIDVYALLRDSESRKREGLRLELAGDARWRGNLLLRRSEHRGALDLTLMAVLRVDRRSEVRVATRRSERIAGSEVWKLYLDDKPWMPGGAIEGEWRHFPSDQLEPLRERGDCAWYLDLSNSDRPRLFLNEAIEGLKAALGNPQRIGRSARVREAIAHSVLQPVLLGMAIEALIGAPGTRFDELGGWRRDLLLSLARQMENGTEERVIERWLARWKDDGRALVTADLSAAIQRHVGMPDAARQLIKTLEEQRG